MSALGNQALLSYHRRNMEVARFAKFSAGVFCVASYGFVIWVYLSGNSLSGSENRSLPMDIFCVMLIANISSLLTYGNWRSQKEHKEMIEKIKTENEFRYLAFNGSAAEVCETADNWDFWHKRENAEICGIYVWKVIKMVRYPWFAGVFVSAMIKCVPQELIKDENRESLLDCVAKGLVNYSDEAVIDSFLAGIRAKNEKFADAIKEAMKPSKEDAPQAA